MKRFIVTILAVFYLGVTSGATVYFHYCMGRLVETGLASKESQKCGKCGMDAESSKSCCKHESKQVKIDSAQKLVDYSLEFKSINSHVDGKGYLALPEIYISTVTEEQPLVNAPPGTDSTPVFIRNCNFRI